MISLLLSIIILIATIVCYLLSVSTMVKTCTSPTSIKILAVKNSIAVGGWQMESVGKGGVVS